eukprot:TRINITY_DN4381_c0_g1_i1.p1 TRINITY_DN4381_c0_g1~~TRINITY_DN4381_c0_g1_i1.p1  ORF type:complete len:117 (-),score=19.69 TRINITY_DN4381_c0_g1_i1:58-408(-)
MSDCIFQFLNNSFCPVCGSVLPLVTDGPVLSCLVCKHKIPVKLLESVEEHSVHHCSDSTQAKLADMAESMSEVDRVCSKCGNSRMSYFTQQTRSADEGQTVFYKCTSCGHQEIEAS